jgi:hypothetical protein
MQSFIAIASKFIVNVVNDEKIVTECEFEVLPSAQAMKYS